MTHATVAEQPQSKPSGSQRLVQILVAGLVALVLPMLVIGVAVGEFAAGAMLIGVVLGVAGSKVGGTRRMLYLAPAIGIAAGLGAVTAYDWWWVAVLACTGFITGAGTRFGWMPALLMIPYAATFATQVPSTRDSMIFGAVAAIATVYGVVIARRFGAPDVVEGERLAFPAAAAVAIMFAAVLGGSAAIGVALSWTEPYWVPEPVLILTLYLILGKRDRIAGKALGTTVGALATIPVAIIAPSPWVLAVVAAAAFILALMQAKTYWLMYALYTFSLILAFAAPGQIGWEAEERGLQILAGTALLAIGLVILHALSRRLTVMYPQPELAPQAS